MTKKTLIKRSGRKKSAKNFLMFRLVTVAVLVSAFAVFGFLAKNTMAQSWSEPTAAPPAGNVSAPVWTQNALVQTGNFWVSGKGRFDTSGTGDATCQGAKVCLADGTGGYGLVSEMTSGTGGAGPAVYAQGNAGFGIYASSTSNYAGDFVGNVYVTGTLNAATDLQVNGTQVCLSNGTHCQTGGYWTATGNDIYNNNTGKVGIGTATPAVKLDVSSSGIANALSTNIRSSITGSFSAAQRVGLGSVIGFLNDTGIQYSQIGAYCGSDCTNNQSQLGFWTEGVATTFTTSNPKMVIDASGNVGIGTTTPSSNYGVYSTPLVVQSPVSNYTYMELRGVSNQAGILYNRDGSTGWFEGLNGSGFFRSSQMASINQTGLTNAKDGTTGMTIDTSGKVGIGTSTPNQALEVLNASNTQLRLTYDATHFANLGTAANGNFIFDNSSHLANFGPIASPGNLVAIQTTATNGGAVQIFSTHWVTEGPLILGTFSNKANQLYLDPSGKVGIGTATPAYKLDVSGQVNATGYCISGANCIAVWPSGGGGTVTSSGSSANYIAKFSTATNVTNSLIYDNGTNVGIGTATSNQKLQVVGGSVGIFNGAADRGLTVNPGLTAGIVDIYTDYLGGSEAKLHLSSYTDRAGSNGVTIQSGGKVGINTATPGSALDVKGAVNFSGATSGYMAVAVPAAVTSYTLTFPAAVGASGQVLQTTNGTGTLGWVTPAAGGGTVTSSGSANYVPLFTTATNIGNSVIQQSGSSIGIGVSPTHGVLDSEATANTGVYGSSTNALYYGVQGVNTSNTGGSGTGVYGLSSATGGNGVRGDETSASGVNSGATGNDSSPQGYGVVGYNSSLTGTAVGVYGDNSSTSGVGVLGSTFAVSGTTYGVEGTTASASGYGLYTPNRASAAQYCISGANCISAWPSGGSGTVTNSGSAANYVAKFSSSTNITDSLIYDNGTKVGIGTTTPGAYMDVEAGLSGSVAVKGISTNNVGVDGESTGSTGVLGVSTNGNGVVGQSSASLFAGVEGQSNSASAYGVWGSNTAGGYGVYSSGAIYSTGNITAGAGTSISAPTLQSTGNTFVNATLFAAAVQSSGSVTGASSAAFGPAIYGTASAASGYGLYGNNSAGGGSAIAVYGVTWAGGYGFYTSQNSYVGGTLTAGSISSGNITGGAGSTFTAPSITATGNAWVNASLTVGGNVFAAGFIPNSDIRLKKNIKPLNEDDGLNIVGQLNPVTFNWKDTTKGTNLNYGFIAQDMQKVLPDLVSANNDGMLGINYNGLIAPMVKSIQEQQKEIDDLKLQIAQLKAK